MPKLNTDKAPNQVNNGLLRLGEVEQVTETLTKHLHIDLTVVDASQRFLDALKGISEPEEKRKRIGRMFIEVFQETALKLSEAAAESPNVGDIGWLLQGTLYPDVVSVSGVDIPLFGLRREVQDIPWLFRILQGLIYALKLVVLTPNRLRVSLSKVDRVPVHSYVLMTIRFFGLDEVRICC